MKVRDFVVWVSWLATSAILIFLISGAVSPVWAKDPPRDGTVIAQGNTSVALAWQTTTAAVSTPLGSVAQSTTEQPVVDVQWYRVRVGDEEWLFIDRRRKDLRKHSEPPVQPGTHLQVVKMVGGTAAVKHRVFCSIRFDDGKQVPWELVDRRPVSSEPGQSPKH